MEITIIPQLSDNFCYHVTHGTTSFIVDCSEAHKVESYLNGRQISHILTTHKHNDHSGGNLDLKQKFDVQVVGGLHDNIPGVTLPVEDKQVLQIGDIRITCLHTPCHTRGHILYLCEVENEGIEDYSVEFGTY